MRRSYSRFDTGTASGAANGISEQRKPAPMPHHIVAVTRGAAAIDASIPAN
jgi:hypothetical protein